MSTPKKRPMRQPTLTDEWNAEDQKNLAAPPIRSKRDVWEGLTPEEAYRRGVADGEEHQREQERRREEREHPLICSTFDTFFPKPKPIPAKRCSVGRKPRVIRSSDGYPTMACLRPLAARRVCP